MIYAFSLQAVGIATGLVLLAAHVFGFLNAEACRRSLPGFPRCPLAGKILTTIAAAWTLWLVATIDLGEFSGLRRPLLVLVPAAWLLTMKFVDEFLAVRALGFLALLAAEPLLEAAFLKPPASRILLVTLAYAWVVAGLLWVGMPYLLRDQIAWAVRGAARWKAFMTVGAAYGLAVLLCAIAFWGA